MRIQCVCMQSNTQTLKHLVGVTNFLFDFIRLYAILLLLHSIYVAYLKREEEKTYYYSFNLSIKNTSENDKGKLNTKFGNLIRIRCNRIDRILCDKLFLFYFHFFVRLQNGSEFNLYYNGDFRQKYTLLIRLLLF